MRHRGTLWVVLGFSSACGSAPTPRAVPTASASPTRTAGPAPHTSAATPQPPRFRRTSLVWTSNYIGPGSPFGIHGYWWFDNDCTGASSKHLPCAQRAVDLTGPDGKAGWSLNSERVCARGVVEPIDDYSAQWGADIGFDLNQQRDGTATAYDATGIAGLMFDVSGSVGGHFQVEVIMQGVKHTFFKVVSVPMKDVAAPFSGPDALRQDPKLDAADRVPLDLRRLTEVHFVVIGAPAVSTPFDFCVSDVRLLQ